MLGFALARTHLIASIFLLCCAITFLPDSSSAEENPFRSRSFLEASLGSLGFNEEILSIRSNVNEDEPIVVSERIDRADVHDLVIGGEVRRLRMTGVPLLGFLGSRPIDFRPLT